MLLFLFCFVFQESLQHPQELCGTQQPQGEVSVTKKLREELKAQLQTSFLALPQVRVCKILHPPLFPSIR